MITTNCTVSCDVRSVISLHIYLLPVQSSILHCKIVTINIIIYLNPESQYAKPERRPTKYLHAPTLKASRSQRKIMQILCGQGQKPKQGKHKQTNKPNTEYSIQNSLHYRVSSRCHFTFSVTITGWFNFVQVLRL